MRFLADENFPGEAVSALRNKGHPSSCGIVLFRIPMSSPGYVASIAVSALEGRADWEGHFAVIEESHIRFTPLPENKH